MSFPRYERYKDSGVEWLGKVPEHWDELPLKAVASYNDEVLDDRTADDYELLYVDISSVDATTGISSKEALIYSSAPSRARRRVKHGDVIVSTVRTYLRAIARIHEPEENLIVSTGFCVVRPRQRLFHGFLGYLVSSNYFVDAVISHSVGVSYPAINASDLVSIKITLPPIPEQQTIAAFLDRETAKIDALIAEQQRLIELLKEKRQAVISHAVTKGLNPDAPMKDSGVEWLGEVPEHWEVCALNYRFQVELGKMLDEKRITGKHLAPYLRNTDVQWGKINIQELPEMDFHGDDLARYGLKFGDLLVCEGGDVGRAAIWRGELDECYYQKALHRLRARTTKADTSEFFYFVLYSAASRGVFSESGKSTIAHLTAEAFRRYRFPFPPIAEQKAIAVFLDRETAKLDALTAEAQTAITLLQERRTALISAAVTGKIDVRGFASDSTH